MKTNAELVEAARDPGGSLGARHAAFERLVHRSQGMVLGRALASLRDPEDARDAAQDAFAAAWRRLPQLRDPAAFPAWLRAIVDRECSRRRRGRAAAGEPADAAAPVDAATTGLDYRRVLARALAGLPAGEREVVELFYYQGRSLPEIARRLGLKPGTAGKRLHSARLRIRAALPRSVRADFMRVAPGAAFAARVRRGLLDEYVGEFRFESRPDHVVRIAREGDRLVAESGGQRHVLVDHGERSFVARHYDGEARFVRSRRGEVTHFVYYELGRRLGVARRVE